MYMAKHDLLKKTWGQARTYRADVRFEEIQRLCESAESQCRLLGLLLARRQIERGEPASRYFELARWMVPDTENDCRWQAMIVIGESIASNPDAVWEIVCEYGDSADSDMRTAMATVLLEHLLDHDFERYFAFVRKEISRGRVRLLNTLSMCWISDEDARNRKDAYVGK
jgi:hypothetical protein